jgi:hypothetical protein
MSFLDELESRISWIQGLEIHSSRDLFGFGCFFSFFMLILFQLNPSMFIYFLNFISNSFITLKFGSKFNPTQRQLIPNQGSN